MVIGLRLPLGLLALVLLVVSFFLGAQTKQNLLGGSKADKGNCVPDDSLGSPPAHRGLPFVSRGFKEVFVG